jgi:hypothetical protein
MKRFMISLIVVTLPWAAALAQEAKPAAPAISLADRHGHVTPVRQGFNHTGGGNIDVAQPTPDSVLVTMSGVATAGAHPCKDSVASMTFELHQCFEVTGDRKGPMKIVLEARAIGLLRSHKCCCCECCGLRGGGTAEMTVAQAAITTDCAELTSIALTPHAVTCGENLSINDREGPVEAPIVPGKYVLHQTFVITASHPHCLVPIKAASAEFAPDPALDPLWISVREPFHGAIKKDLGFQVVVRVLPGEATPPVKTASAADAAALLKTASATEAAPVLKVASPK